MKRLEEQDIRRLLEAPPAAPPPDDLADLLKAQIPDPLPQWDEEEAAAPSPDPSPQPLRGPWLQNRWRTVGRLAAALVAMFGVGALSLQLLQWSTSTLDAPAAFEVANQTSEDSSLSEESRGAGSMSDDGLSKSRPEGPVLEAEASGPDALTAESPMADTPMVDTSVVDPPRVDTAATGVPESLRSVPESSGSAAAELSKVAETSDTLPPRRAKRVAAPTVSAAPAAPSVPAQTAVPSETAASAATARRLEVPVDAERRDRVTAPLDDPPSEARRVSRSSREATGIQGTLVSEAKQLEETIVSTPWTLTEAAPRLQWRPSAVDVSMLDAWRQGSAGQNPPLGAALLTYGVLSTPSDPPNGLRLDMAPSPNASLDGTFWLLVETTSPELDGRFAPSPVSLGLDLEFSPRAVARYHVLADGFDEKVGIGRLLVAMQLASSLGASEEDVLVRVRRVASQGSRDADGQETAFLRRDVVPDWRRTPWTYRVQTLGVGLVQAFEARSDGAENLALAELRRKAQDLQGELSQRSTTEARKSQLNHWLEWWIRTTETKD